MNEQNIPQLNEPVQNSKNVWIIIVSIVSTALIVGGGVYAWQRSSIKSTEQSLQQQIISLQKQINQLQQNKSQTITPSNSSENSNDLSDEKDASSNNAKESTTNYQVYQERPYDDLQPHEPWGYEFKYPYEFTLKQGDHPNYPTGSFLKTHQSGAGTWSAPVAISIRLDDAYLGTNFQSAWLTVAYDPDIANLENCRESHRNNMVEKLPDTQSINDISWYKGTMGSAATGTSIQSRVYHTLHNGMCYEVNLHIATTNISNYDPSSGITVSNEDEIWNQLENLLSTFIFIE